MARMAIRRKPKQPDRQTMSVWLHDVKVTSVADAMLLKDRFATEFKPGTQRQEDYSWHDFSNVQHEDIYLSEDFGTLEACISIPESPERYADRLEKYNIRLATYNEWAKDKKVEIKAEEKRREVAAVKKKADKIKYINDKIAELKAEAKGLEDEIL